MELASPQMALKRHLWRANGHTPAGSSRAEVLSLGQ